MNMSSFHNNIFVSSIALFVINFSEYYSITQENTSRLPVKTQAGYSVAPMQRGSIIEPGTMPVYSKYFAYNRGGYEFGISPREEPKRQGGSLWYTVLQNSR